MVNINLRNLLKKDSLSCFLKVYTPAILLIVLFFLFSYLKGTNFAVLSRDPIQLLGGKVYAGVLSRIGVILWCVTAAILIFSARITQLQGKSKSIGVFLFFSGLLTSVLMVDDFFLFHDVILPQYFHVNEKILYLFYGLSVVALFYFFSAIILNSDYVFLIFSFGFLGCSVLTDIVIEMAFNIPNSFVFEDGFKFLGIVSWAVYFIRISFRHIKPVEA